MPSITAKGLGREIGKPGTTQKRASLAKDRTWALVFAFVSATLNSAMSLYVNIVTDEAKLRLTKLSITASLMTGAFLMVLVVVKIYQITVIEPGRGDEHGISDIEYADLGASLIEKAFLQLKSTITGVLDRGSVVDQDSSPQFYDRVEVHVYRPACGWVGLGWGA